MKQFDSSEASLPSPTKLDLKVMKETADMVSTETEAQKLSTAENQGTQNSSKKMLETVDLNSSLVISENSLKKDSGRTTSCGASEKENLITANGFSEETATDETDTEIEIHLSRSDKTSGSILEQEGHSSSKLRNDDSLDCRSEENAGNKSTMQVPGTSCVSDDGDDQVMTDNLTNGTIESLEDGEPMLLNNDEAKLELGEELSCAGESPNSEKQIEGLAEECVLKDESMEPLESAIPDKSFDDCLDELVDDVEPESVDDGDDLDSLAESEMDAPNSVDESLGIVNDTSSSIHKLMDFETKENEKMDSCDELTKTEESQSLDKDEETTRSDSSDELPKVSESQVVEISKQLSSDSVLQIKDSQSSDKSLDQDHISSGGIVTCEKLQASDELVKDGEIISDEHLLKTDEFNSIEKSMESSELVSSDLMKVGLECTDKQTEDSKVDEYDNSMKSEETRFCDTLPEADEVSLDHTTQTAEFLSGIKSVESGAVVQFKEQQSSNTLGYLDEMGSSAELKETEPVLHSELNSNEEAVGSPDTLIEELGSPVRTNDLSSCVNRQSPEKDVVSTSDKLAETNNEQPIDKPSAENDIGSSDKSAETSNEQPIDKPSAENDIRSSDKSAETSNEQPIDKPSAENDISSSDKSAETSNEQPVDKPSPDNAISSSDKLAETNNEQPIDKPSLDNAISSSDKLAETNNEQPIDKPSTDNDISSSDEQMEAVDGSGETSDLGFSDESMETSKSGKLDDQMLSVPLKSKQVNMISASDEGISEEEKTDISQGKLKVSYRQLNKNSFMVGTGLSDSDISDFDTGTNSGSLNGANLGADFEEDLRAMEDSLWLDDINKPKSKLISKSSSEDKKTPAADEERLNRKRTSEEIEVEVSKRTKVSASEEVDSDGNSDTSKRRQSDNVEENQAKKVRTMDGEKEKSSHIYHTNLDKIIDQVATGVLSVNENSREESIAEDCAENDITIDSDKNTADTPSKNYKPMPFVRKLYSEELKKINRNDLEELVVQKICEVVTERCHTGELRQRTLLLEQMVEQSRKKAQLLSKQVRDMEMVMKRFANDQKFKKDRIVLPVKITRSVGLQVHMGQSNQVGFSKGRSMSDGNRQPMRRRFERPAPPPAPPPAPTPGPSPSATPSPAPPPPSTNPPSKNATPTSAPNTPQKISPTFPKTTVNSSSVPNSPIVRQASTPSTPPATKPTAPPLKTTVSRSVAPTPTVTTVNTTSSIRLSTNIVATTRVAKPVYSTAGMTPIAPKLNSDLIDLTDEEDRTRSSALRNALSAASTDALTPTTVTSVLTSSALTTSVAGRGIRVLQQHQLTGGNTTTAAILTPTGTDGQRLAYLVPTSTMSSQTRQLLLTSAPQQVRAGSVMPMSGRPTILFKSAPVVSMAQSALPPGTMVNPGVTSTASTLVRPNSSLTALSSQQRPTQIRMPTSMVTSVGRMASTVNSMVTTQATLSHPAPLPSLPPYGPTSLNLKLAPPKPELKISKVPTKNTQGIVLSWNMTLSSEHEEVASYQLYAYQEGNAPPSTTLWKKVGDVKALPLPMACTLTQFQEGHKYHFAVRAVDVHMRCGQFSAPGNIVLTRK